MPLNRAAEQVNAQEVSGSRCGGAAALFCCTGEKLLQTASQSSLNISYPKGNHNSIYFFTKCQAAEFGSVAGRCFNTIFTHCKAAISPGITTSWGLADAPTVLGDVLKPFLVTGMAHLHSILCLCPTACPCAGVSITCRA